MAATNPAAQPDDRFEPLRAVPDNKQRRKRLVDSDHWRRSDLQATFKPGIHATGPKELDFRPIPQPELRTAAKHFAYNNIFNPRQGERATLPDTEQAKLASIISFAAWLHEQHPELPIGELTVTHLTDWHEAANGHRSPSAQARNARRLITFLRVARNALPAEGHLDVTEQVANYDRLGGRRRTSNRKLPRVASEEAAAKIFSPAVLDTAAPFTELYGWSFRLMACLAAEGLREGSIVVTPRYRDDGGAFLQAASSADGVSHWTVPWVNSKGDSLQDPIALVYGGSPEFLTALTKQEPPIKRWLEEHENWLAEHHPETQFLFPTVDAQARDQSNDAGIIRLNAEGLTDAAVERKLNLSKGTVRRYRAAIEAEHGVTLNRHPHGGVRDRSNDAGIIRLNAEGLTDAAVDRKLNLSKGTVSRQRAAIEAEHGVTLNRHPGGSVRDRSNDAGIIRLNAEGLTDGAVDRKLNLSKGTVRRYRAAIEAEHGVTLNRRGERARDSSNDEAIIRLNGEGRTNAEIAKALDVSQAVVRARRLSVEQITAHRCQDNSRAPDTAENARPELVAKAFKQLSEAAGVEYVNPHSWRHRLITQLVMRGVSGEAIRKRVGHVSPRMMEDYVHITDDFMAREMSKAERFAADGTRLPVPKTPQERLAQELWAANNNMGENMCGLPVGDACPRKPKFACQGCSNAVFTVGNLPVIHERITVRTGEIEHCREQLAALPDQASNPAKAYLRDIKQKEADVARLREKSDLILAGVEATKEPAKKVSELATVIEIRKEKSDDD